ncbi:hypothetical protein V6N13_142217 [Hibiscus sabdariffa]|uniref:Uncharacterized protein n=1 Tax=Hibiscus sabdariffa TaxID=183260 RepID=A0ABR2FDK4_9ROSI
MHFYEMKRVDDYVTLVKQIIMSRLELCVEHDLVWKPSGVTSTECDVEIEESFQGCVMMHALRILRETNGTKTSLGVMETIR